MTYRRVQARLQLAQANTDLLGVVADLAMRFDAEVSGLVVSRNLADLYTNDYVTDEIVEQVRARTAKDMREAEQAFRVALTSRAKALSWHAAETGGELSACCAQAASSADIIVVAPDSASMFHSSYHFNVGDLLMRAGRPVLVVPPGTDRLKLDQVLVGWKETAEARRAIADALPLLKVAGRVVLAEIAAHDHVTDARDRLSAVADWLALHGVHAVPMVLPRKASDSTGLAELAREQGADLIVAGAYGHSRVREWVLGGVTCDLLLDPPCLAFLSH
ncbi:universal stress protein [Sphingomonas oryzagri]